MHDLTTHSALTTYRIAEIVGIRHRDVMATVMKYMGDLCAYGTVTILREPTTSKGAPRRYCRLNTPQFAFVLTRCRNKCISSMIGDFVASLPKAHSDAIIDMLETMDIKDLPPDRFVYVAVEAETGNYKVGISIDPERRVKELNIGNPRELSLVKVFLAAEDGYLSETQAHKRLAEHHIRSEWFGPDSDLETLTELVMKRIPSVVH